MADEPTTYELFRAATYSASHLEMRDAYTPDDPDWQDWREGRRFDPAERWKDWFDLIRETVTRGVQVGAHSGRFRTDHGLHALRVRRDQRSQYRCG
jgi:hypothetical protein